MTNPLTATRLDVAAQVADATGFWVDDGTDPPADATGTVYPSPPAGITVPCVVLAPSAQGGAVITFGAWEYPLDLWMYAHGADFAGLEDVLAAVLPLYPTASFEPPQASLYGGTTYLAALITVDCHASLD